MEDQIQEGAVCAVYRNDDSNKTGGLYEDVRVNLSDPEA